MWLHKRQKKLFVAIDEIYMFSVRGGLPLDNCILRKKHDD
jgi:hypothetical protein